MAQNQQIDTVAPMPSQVGCNNSAAGIKLIAITGTAVIDQQVIGGLYHNGQPLTYIQHGHF